jgi:hypothetical protein
MRAHQPFAGAEACIRGATLGETSKNYVRGLCQIAGPVLTLYSPQSVAAGAPNGGNGADKPFYQALQAASYQPLVDI